MPVETELDLEISPIIFGSGNIKSLIDVPHQGGVKRLEVPNLAPGIEVTEITSLPYFPLIISEEPYPFGDPERQSQELQRWFELWSKYPSHCYYRPIKAALTHIPTVEEFGGIIELAKKSLETPN